MTFQVPEDLAMILNDSSLFSNNAEITSKEILKRYGDRARPPTVNSGHAVATAQNGMTSPPGSAPMVTRVDTDPHQQSAWQNESSVRHVGSDPDAMTPPNIPYANPNASSESHGNGSPNRMSARAGAYTGQRAMMT